MTLIHFWAADGIMGISDILTSRPAFSEAAPIHLPLQLNPVTVQRGGWNASGLAQKAVLVSPDTLLMWSGSLAVARVIVEAAARASDGGHDLLPQSFIGTLGLSQEEMNSVSIIYAHVRGDRIEEWHMNALQTDLLNGFYVQEGSGAWHFSSDSTVAEVERPCGHKVPGPMPALLRALTSSVGEALNGDTFDFLYGGWMEITVEEGEGFQKVPHAIKLWKKHDPLNLINLPAFFSWYQGPSLFVARAEFRPDHFGLHVHGVSDFLCRDDPLEKMAIQPVWEPRFVCHVLVPEDGERPIYLIRDGRPDEFTVNLRSGDLGMSVSKELVATLLAEDFAGMPLFSIDRPSSL